MHEVNFWKNLARPIIGLSPMDGVTDAAFRYMVARHSKPSVMMTEFTNVEGLARGASEMLKAFIYGTPAKGDLLRKERRSFLTVLADTPASVAPSFLACHPFAGVPDEIERPIVAQIYGVEVDSFYKCTVMLLAMGFDGVDINMGCPANKVASRGSGAGLIRTPELAKEIIRACKKGAVDFANGISLEEAGVHENLRAVVEVRGERVLKPISVKTRIGFDEDTAEEWIAHVLEEKPANITLHGRTLKQMYLGKANWEAIGRAAALAKGSGVSFLGNGDVESMAEAREKCEQYGLDGVLVGRAVMGCPWFFDGVAPSSFDERMEILLEHCRYFVGLGHLPFHVIKKHLAWYCKDFNGAKEMRMGLMRSSGLDEVEEIVKTRELES